MTEGNFQELVDLSAQVPVVIALWASYSPGSGQLVDVLEGIVESYDGRLVLGAADIDVFPELAQAFQVQAVPTAVAVVKGQPVPLFQGGADEQQVRSLFDELLKVAAANGVTGRIGAGGPGGAGPEAPPLPPLHQAAFDAIEAGDMAAAAAYRQALNEMPADAEAKAGLAQVELMDRLQTFSGPEADALRRLAADEPDNLEAQLGGRGPGYRRWPHRGRPRPDRDVHRPQLRPGTGEPPGSGCWNSSTSSGTGDERVAKARQGLARVLF